MSCEVSPDYLEIRLHNISLESGISIMSAPGAIQPYFVVIYNIFSLKRLMGFDSPSKISGSA